jgi:cation transport protein ChaC
MSWRRTVLRGIADDNSPLWVFGYGSLMWRPDFRYLEICEARLYGFHRAPCIYSFHHRGAKQNPGLVMGLDGGGSCKGRALKVAPDEAPAVLDYLHDREMISGVYVPSLRPVHLAAGVVISALCFVVERDHAQYAGGLAFDEQAALVRNGVGSSGKCLDYFAATVEHLDELGVNDSLMHQLLDVARDQA